LEFLHGGGPKGGGKSNVLGIHLFLLLFLVFLLFLKVPKGTQNLRKFEAKGKAIGWRDLSVGVPKISLLMKYECYLLLSYLCHRSF